MDLSSLVHKPKDELIPIFLKMTYPMLIQIRRFHPRLAEILSGDNQDFWYQKYIQDYSIPLGMVSSWQILYQDQAVVWNWTCGSDQRSWTSDSDPPRVIPGM